MRQERALLVQQPSGNLQFGSSWSIWVAAILTPCRSLMLISFVVGAYLQSEDDDQNHEDMPAPRLYGKRQHVGLVIAKLTAQCNHWHYQVSDRCWWKQFCFGENCCELWRWRDKWARYSSIYSTMSRFPPMSADQNPTKYSFASITRVRFEEDAS